MHVRGGTRAVCVQDGARGMVRAHRQDSERGTERARERAGARERWCGAGEGACKMAQGRRGCGLGQV